MTPRKKSDIQPLTPETPIYPIGVAAQLLDVHPRTLRIYEEEGLIAPAHKGQRRMFSENDLRWIGCLRRMIHEQGISISGIKKLLTLAPCWEIAECPAGVCEECSASVDRAAPRTIRVAGDKRMDKAARAAERGLLGSGAEQRKKVGRH
jgi:MerR family transcriptional regulator/heat shock protein HspR